MKSYEGLGVVLLDYLTSDAVDGFVDEKVIAEAMRLSSKFIRKTLRYLQEEHLLVSESVKYSIKRTNNVEEPDDPEIDATFNLFSETWQARIDAGKGDAISSGTELCILENAVDPVTSDPTQTLRSWAVVVNYLLRDYRFIHE